MKKNILYLAIICAMAALVSCSKDGNSIKREYRLQGRVSMDATKVIAVNPDENTVNFNWQVNDTVVITDLYNYAYYYAVKKESDIDTVNHTAVFSGTEEVPESYSALTVHAFQALISSTRPYESNYIEGSFNPTGYGEGDANGFTMNCFYPVLHLKLKGNVTIGSIEFYSDSAEEVGHELENKLNCGEGVQLNGTAKDIYFPILWRSDKVGFSLIFFSPDGDTLKSVRSSTQIGNDEYVNKIVSFPELEINSL